MAAFARWCSRHRRVVLALWILALVGFFGLKTAAGSVSSDNFTLPHTDSQDAYNLLKADFPSQAGDTVQIVLHATTGRLTDPQQAAAATAMLDRVAALPHVRSVTNPLSAPQARELSSDKTVGLADAVLDTQAHHVPKVAVQAIISTAQAADRPGLQVQLGGNAVRDVQSQRGTSNSLLLGALFAMIVLWIAFGSVLAALLPLLTAIMAIGIGTSFIALLSHVFTIAPFASELSILIGLGVGVDYSLFIVSRHRAGLKAGRHPEQAAAAALNTSGRAVFFAGLIVCIALLGQFALGVSFLYGVAISAALTVLLTMLTSLTLLPAMLGFLGPKALSRRERRRLQTDGAHAEEAEGLWARWAVWVQGKSLPLAALGLVVIVGLAVPVLSLRLGLSDEGNDPPSTTTRQAYDLLAKGFGPGFSGPLQVAGALGSPQDIEAFRQFVAAAQQQPGVAAVTAARVSPNRRAAVALVYPTTAPQDPKTASLMRRLRGSVAPPFEARSTLRVHVGGATATTDDFSHLLSSKLPLFIGVVVVLAFLLLLIVFRSVLVPLTASVMNLLSVGAAFGVLNAIFQWGWAGSFFGVDRTGPVDVFVPVLLFSILFGLSMDYEVFLVSRMHEAWVHTGDNRHSVTIGQAATGRVITAAAAIMILVFGSFVLGGERVIKEFGIGLGGAVLIDAFVIRTILVPSVMHLFGAANWWLPRRVERLLPHVALDPADIPETVPEPVATPV
ncbi:MAG: MMPL family transporter [Acidimicrobiales bacterium]